ncbi:MAG: tyrosine-type recombinase/integrase [Clostridiaceae bacterium]|jgi:integrase/recombinase XerC|nr:tyrosine-type recombinase/integrase [Clostridiaceae bacterium]
MDLVISQENRAIQKQPNFSELLEGFISYLDVSEASIRAYMKATKQFYIYIMEHGITEPTRQDVIGFREQLKTEGKKASTIQNYITGLRQFFKWTEGTGAYPNIAKDVKGVRLNHTHKKDYLTSRQVKNVLQGMERKTKIGKRNYAIVTLMLTGGLRTIEVSRANIEDIRTVRDQSVLFLQGKGRDDRNEYIKLIDQVEDAITDYLKNRDTVDAKDPLFTSSSNNSKGNRLSTRTVSYIAKTAMQQAGYDSDRLTAHSLRHTTATLNLINGGTLEETQQLLRHENISTTMIYLHHLERADNHSEERIGEAIF